jgi:hypothetical protein
MRRLFYPLAILALLWPAASNAWTLTAHNAAASANTTSVTSAAVNDTGANLVVVVVGWYEQVGGDSISVTDSASNTWGTPVTTIVAGSLGLATYYLVNPTTSASYTVTIGSTGNPTYPAVAIMAWSGATNTPLDQTNINHGTGTTGLTGSITTTANGELIVAGLAGSDPASVPTIDSGFTVLDYVASVAGVTIGVTSGYLVQSTAATISPTWSWTNSSAWDAGVQSFFGTSPSCTSRSLRGVGC